MSPNRKCMNFDKLTDWRRENRLDYDKFRKTMQRKEGQKAVPVPDAAYLYPDIHLNHDHHHMSHGEGSNL